MHFVASALNGFGNCMIWEYVTGGFLQLFVDGMVEMWLYLIVGVEVNMKWILIEFY